MKQVTNVEQGLRATLVDIAARNAALHIYTAVDEAGALTAARASDARLAAGKPLSAIDGVIVSVKDNIDVAGLPTTAGLGFRRAAVAENDASNPSSRPLWANSIRRLFPRNAKPRP